MKRIWFFRLLVWAKAFAHQASISGRAINVTDTNHIWVYGSNFQKKSYGQALLHRSRFLIKLKWPLGVRMYVPRFICRIHVRN